MKIGLNFIWFGTFFYMQPAKLFIMLIILGTPIETASALDSKRLNQQIALCDRIIKKIKAGKSLIALNSHLWWLQLYCNTLDYYKKGYYAEAAEMSYLAERYKPAGLTDAIIRHNRHYLAHKDPQHYSQWT